MIKDLIRPLYHLVKRENEPYRFKKHLRTNSGDIKIVVGSSCIFDKGWIPTEVHFLNLLKVEYWKKYFDEDHVFHAAEWDKKEGFIHRSIKFDRRNVDSKPNYTSLMVDAIKR